MDKSLDNLVDLYRARQEEEAESPVNVLLTAIRPEMDILIINILTREGFNVVYASSDEGAIFGYEYYNPDVIISSSNYFGFMDRIQHERDNLSQTLGSRCNGANPIIGVWNGDFESEVTAGSFLEISDIYRDGTINRANVRKLIGKVNKAVEERKAFEIKLVSDLSALTKQILYEGASPALLTTRILSDSNIEYLFNRVKSGFIFYREGSTKGIKMVSPEVADGFVFHLKDITTENLEGLISMPQYETFKHPVLLAYTSSRKQIIGLFLSTKRPSQAYVCDLLHKECGESQYRGILMKILLSNIEILKEWWGNANIGESQVIGALENYLELSDVSWSRLGRIAGSTISQEKVELSKAEYIRLFDFLRSEHPIAVGLRDPRLYGLDLDAKFENWGVGPEGNMLPSAEELEKFFSGEPVQLFRPKELDVYDSQPKRVISKLEDVAHLLEHRAIHLDRVSKNIYLGTFLQLFGPDLSAQACLSYLIFSAYKGLRKMYKTSVYVENEEMAYRKCLIGTNQFRTQMERYYLEFEHYKHTAIYYAKRLAELAPFYPSKNFYDHLANDFEEVPRADSEFMAVVIGVQKASQSLLDIANPASKYLNVI